MKLCIQPITTAAAFVVTATAVLVNVASGWKQVRGNYNENRQLSFGEDNLKDDEIKIAKSYMRRRANHIPCESDDDCLLGAEYCSSGSCRTFGTCGNYADCVNPSNLYNVIYCVGYLFCSVDGLCGISCGDSSCPPDKEPVQCFASPCEVDRCNDPDVVTCIDDYCGGCNSIFLDLAGKEVCTTINDDNNGDYFSLASDDSYGCLAISNLSDGSSLMLGSCGYDNHFWRYDSDTGLFHSMLDDNKCMQAGHRGRPKRGTKMRVYTCDANNDLQRFDYIEDRIILMNSSLCVVFQGANGDLDEDPIILKPCNISDGQDEWSPDY